MPFGNDHLVQIADFSGPPGLHILQHGNPVVLGGGKRLEGESRRIVQLGDMDALGPGHLGQLPAEVSMTFTVGACLTAVAPVRPVSAATTLVDTLAISFFQMTPLISAVVYTSRPTS